MKLRNVAALAEIISSVTVVATLIYLSIQTHQPNSALLATSREATMQADTTLIAALIGNPEAMANAQRPLAELTAAEKEQVRNVLAGVLRSSEFAWLQYRNGTLDGTTLASYMETPIRWIRSDEAFGYYWEYFSKTTDPDYRSYVNALLERSDDTAK
jgi:hypothetical protein